MEKFHEKLKELRKEQKLTQQNLADILSMKRATIAKWETGRTEPNFEKISMLACIFDVSIDYLLGDYLQKARSERNEVE